MPASSSETGWLPLSQRDARLLQAVLRRLAAELRPEEIWLFGSRASGQPREGSDIDLLAVLPNGATADKLDPIAAFELVRGSGLPVDLVPCTRAEFDDERDEIDSLPRAAYTKGLCVFMSVEKRIRAYLDLTEQDIEAAEVLAKAGNRYAAYHCQQAVEKLLKALLLHAGIEAGVEHRLDVLISRFGEGHPWGAVLRPLDKFTPFATTFRYPTPGGRIPTAPPPETLLQDLAALRALLGRARGEMLPQEES